MPRQLVTPLIGLTLTLASVPVFAQPSTVPDSHKYAWSENCGWLNFRDAGSPVASQGVRIGLPRTFMAGFAWGENIGWMNFGDGTPTNGTSYANVDGSDAGVNLDSLTGLLSGYAWGENVGWINFAAGAAQGQQYAARVAGDSAKRLMGYAWGENIGWINLDDAEDYVGIACPADINFDGLLSVQDIFDFLTAWFANDSSADMNGGGVTVQDLFDFLAAWFAGC